MENFGQQIGHRHKKAKPGPHYEVPYAKKQRALQKQRALRKKKDHKVGGDFWGDVGNFFTQTLPDVASQALPLLLAAL